MKSHTSAIWDLLTDVYNDPKEIADIKLHRVSGMVDYAYLVRDLTDEEEQFLREQIATMRSFKRLQEE